MMWIESRTGRGCNAPRLHHKEIAVLKLILKFFGTKNSVEANYRRECNVDYDDLCMQSLYEGGEIGSTGVEQRSGELSDDSVIGQISKCK